MEADDRDGSSKFRWKIENFSKITTVEIYSDVFDIGGYPWRLLIFPKGNSNNGWFSMYLDVADSDSLPFDWTRYAEFILSVINQADHSNSMHKEFWSCSYSTYDLPLKNNALSGRSRFREPNTAYRVCLIGSTNCEESIFQKILHVFLRKIGVLILNAGKARHVFNPRQGDWGFTSFIPLSKLHDHNEGFLVNDTLVVEIQILIPRDELKLEPSDGGLEIQVHFRSLENTKENVFSLNLWMLLTYNEVVRRVSRHLGIRDPSKIRLIPHNCLSQQPETNMIEYSGTEDLRDMLVKNKEVSNILYYEEVDVPVIKPDDSEEMQRNPSSCAICLSSPKEGVCVPCGHVVSCMPCLNKIKDLKRGCPICRATIQQSALLNQLYDMD